VIHPFDSDSRFTVNSVHMFFRMLNDFPCDLSGWEKPNVLPRNN